MQDDSHQNFPMSELSVSPYDFMFTPLACNKSVWTVYLSYKNEPKYDCDLSDL